MSRINKHIFLFYKLVHNIDGSEQQQQQQQENILKKKWIKKQT